MCNECAEGGVTLEGVGTVRTIDTEKSEGDGEQKIRG